jgi:diphosphomevalonate decarboxylase
MSKKATVRAPANIAFIKYWGARDLERAIPANPSISMTLDACTTRSTVEHLDEDGAHEIRWRGRGGELEEAPPAFAERVLRHLDFLREGSGCGGRFRVATENSFPAAAGIASSASGFAALTLATLAALGRDASDVERSILARRSGSGSASRSVLGGYVEWPRGESEEECYAFQLAPASHWDLRDVVAVVEDGPKSTSSLDGHRRAPTSPYFEARLASLPRRLAEVRTAIRRRDFEHLGKVIEAEAVDLHCVAMTSVPAIFYWKPETLVLLEEVRRMRRSGLAAYSTLDAGANVHVICLPESQDAVAEHLEALGAVRRTIRDRVGEGPVVESDHLF